MVEYNHDLNNANPSPASGGINCLKCRHYEVTWDPKFPRGCKVFKIKSVRLPSEVVRASTGRDCPAFEPRTPSR